MYQNQTIEHTQYILLLHTNTTNTTTNTTTTTVNTLREFNTLEVFFDNNFKIAIIFIIN